MTEITSNQSPDILVSFAGDVLRMPTTSDTRKAGHSVERSATSSPSRCAAVTTVRSIAVVINPRWWKKTGIDPTVPARALWLETHPLSVATAEVGPAAEGSDIR